MKRLVAIAALAAVPALFAAPAFAATSSTAVAKPSAQVITGYENEVVRLTNAQRTAKGCPALRIDERLRTAARAHSTDMVTRGFFSHTGSNGSTFVAREAAAGYPSRSANAENIAWGYRTPKDVVTGWMNSPGHRANILNCGSVAVGVGLAYTKSGAPYWTQDFGRS
ncbi:CAP domain-containing protein [Paractinoplanes rhizophilus]|uniref:CAP domain-containing protein n=1 Tax=Paractinoplanes rhizophilus TaxID=1416877 RepID=A0ABW2HQ47_9ACTN